MSLERNLAFVTLAFLSIASASSLSAQSSKTKRSTDKSYREHAIQAANWLDTQKQTLSDSKDSIVWPASPSLSQDVSYNLYNGTSGIVLFYLQLHKATQDEQYLERAKQGANGLLSYMDSATSESDPGFWTGYTGISATLAEVFRATKDQRYLDGYQRGMELLKASAKKVNDSVKGPIQFNDVTDIIAGSAGIGFFLLYADDVLKDKDAIGLAVRVADGLLQSAKQVATAENEKQLKWMMSPSFPREMPNYSHGTAGICDFLLALDQKLTSEKNRAPDYDGRFREAAFAGANYLTATANTENESCLIDHHRTEGAQPEDPPLYYLGWCHGPSGTGRLFLNLHASDPKEKKWMAFAIQGGNSLLNSKIPSQRTPGFWNNVGVCCGNSGVGSYLLDLYELNQDGRLKELAVQLTQDTIERADRHGENKIGLSWSHAEHRARPDYLHTQTGLMQGAAGIGLWFLKLDQTLSGSGFELEIPLHPF